MTEEIQRVFYIIIPPWFKCPEHNSKETVHICNRIYIFVEESLWFIWMGFDSVN